MIAKPEKVKQQTAKELIMKLLEKNLIGKWQNSKDCFQSTKLK